ncbi:metal ABC transporter solute-binding protein, Zn/Mn family [Facklamia miroungae]|uniref:Zinc transport system substrate-binding protein n=1 Tax=Facklamia miroungae TaxID=120956 RepID=A0A1G7SIA7_9LACT|nr:zinc ABC transporter substrate-binding protein [Facklamia miroungae]NKZ29642.1 zinc ABC transporter solute-binding protein [Facklamia miroungae]SDG22743.1 zinc transport system substrate-binding protein [Facklamia miroungae]
MSKFSKILASFILGLAVVGQFFSGVIGAQDKPKVMTTFYPVYFLASQIAGDHMEVSMLLEANQDAHAYESSAQDAVKIQESDLFIYQDDEMEYFVNDLLSLVESDATKVLESTEGIDLLSGEGKMSEDHAHEEEDHAHEEEDHNHEGHNHEFDPHTWLDPVIYSKQAENIKEAMIEIDPANSKTYEENYQILKEKLDELNEEYQTKLKNLKNKTIVVQHRAFGYLAHAYGLEQIAIAGLSSDQEPSAQQIAKMQELLKEKQVNKIYVDPAIDSKIAQTVASSTQAELLPLRTLELVSDEEKAAGEDYFTLMLKNLEQLLRN